MADRRPIVPVELDGPYSAPVPLSPFARFALLAAWCAVIGLLAGVTLRRLGVL